jgi:hypothetical protein
MTANEVLTTAQAAEYVGITINCLRAWKSRKSDQLLEGQHWVTGDNNQVLWTAAGLEALQQIKGVMPNTDSDVMTPLQDPMTPPLQDGLLNRYAPLVESVSSAITAGLMGLIDRAVSRNVKEAIAQPMTATECVTLLTELGLKPCNPELLLSSNVAGLLEAKEN